MMPKHRKHRTKASSTESASRTRRKASTESTSSRRTGRRQHSHDRYDRPNRRGPNARERLSDRPDLVISEAPPSYDLSEARDAKDTKDMNSDPKEDPASHAPSKLMSLEARWAWAMILVAPLLASGLLLFLITCSSSDLRTDFSVVKIEISKTTFDTLVKITQRGGDDAEPPILSNEISLGRHLKKTLVEAFMNVGVWGWCVKTADSAQSACYPASVWYSVEETIGGTVTGEISGDAFNTLLTHTLILHGLALLGAMLAIVPVGLYVYRRYYHNDPQAEGGWFQHGSILAAGILSILAWIFDKFFVKGLKKKMGEDTVHSGPAVTLVGVAALLLMVSLMTSAIPVFGRFARFKFSYASRWQNLEEASGDMEKPVASGYPDKKSTRRRRSVRRGRRLKATMTRMFA